MKSYIFVSIIRSLINLYFNLHSWQLLELKTGEEKL